jgi:hypothetical protein
MQQAFSIFNHTVSLSDTPIVRQFYELFGGFLFFQISGWNSNLLSENFPSAGISIHLSTNQHFLGAASVR